MLNLQHPEILDFIVNNDLFDTEHYLKMNTDVSNSGSDPLEHFYKNGWKEGRTPTAWCEKNLLQGINSFDELVNRLISKKMELTYPDYNKLIDTGFFDQKFYSSKYLDIKESGIYPLLHYITYGWKENRQPSPNITIEKSYLSLNDTFESYLKKSEINVSNKKVKDIDVLFIIKNHSLGSAVWRSEFASEQFRNNTIKSMVVTEDEAITFIPLSRVIIFQKFDGNCKNFQKLIRVSNDNDCDIWYDLDDAFLPNSIEYSGQSLTGYWDKSTSDKISNGHFSAIEKCNVILVSTVKIKQLINEALPDKHVIVRKNVLPKRFFLSQPTKYRKTEPLKILYLSGSLSHQLDFEFVSDSVLKFIKNFKDSTLTLLGGDSVVVPDKILKRDNVILKGRCNFSDMLEEISKHDIVLVPLLKNVFNDAKSNIKFIEAAACSTPILTTSTDEFSEVIKDGENGFIEDNPEKWFDRLVQIRKNKEKLFQCGINAYKYCFENLSTENIPKELFDTLKIKTNYDLNRYPNKSHSKYPTWFLKENKYITTVSPQTLKERVTTYIEKKKKRGKAKYVIYTCLTNNYDSLKIPEFLDSDCDYICFTDRPVYNYGVWECREYLSIKNDPTRTSRHPKICPHIYLSDYDYSIYIDANFIPTVSLKNLFSNFSSSNILYSGVKHPWRDCIYDELEACKKSKKDSISSLDSTLDMYKKFKIPKKIGLFENNLIYREHNNKEVICTMETWWDLYNRYSRRDQLTLMVALHLTELNTSLIMQSDKRHVRNSAEFAYFSHSNEDVWYPVIL